MTPKQIANYLKKSNNIWAHFMKPVHLFLTFFVSSAFTHSPAQTNDKSYRIAFYNLENLFNPEDDSLKDDDEFTPDGVCNWSYYRYKEKINCMAKAILAIGGWKAPEIVGVAEIEDKKVLEDLIATNTLMKFNYGIIHYESPDRRGIDVAALYRKDLFKPVYTNNIPVVMPNNPDFATRDILYIKGVFQNGDTIHLFYNHWPSRYDGQKQSEPKRIQAALTARKAVDSIFKTEKTPAILLLGDFNDEWNNVSLLHYLKASLKSKDIVDNALVNLMADMDKNSGSYRYKGIWSYIDQIIVSLALMDNKGCDVENGTAKIVKEDFLLEKDEKYLGIKPHRSFVGRHYKGGFSDHLPVYVDLISHSKDK